MGRTKEQMREYQRERRRKMKEGVVPVKQLQDCVKCREKREKIVALTEEIEELRKQVGEMAPASKAIADMVAGKKNTAPHHPQCKCYACKPEAKK